MRDKNGRFIKGFSSWNKGISPSEETKKKMSEWQKGREPTQREVEMLKKGRKKHFQLIKNKEYWTKERRKNYSEGQKRRYANGGKRPIGFIGKHSKKTLAKFKNSEWHKNFGVNSRLLRKVKATKPELKLFKILDELNISYKPDHLMYNKFFVDAYIPDKNTIIEIDGRYWHSLPKQQLKDKSRNAYLKACGHQVYRFWEDDFDKQKISDFILKGGDKNDNRYR